MTHCAPVKKVLPAPYALVRIASAQADGAACRSCAQRNANHEQRPGRFDAIVIGSGIGGLASVCALTRSGLKVLVGAALANHRVLGDVATGPLLTTALVCATVAVVAVLWPASIGWPFAALAGWTALNLGIRSWRQRGRTGAKASETPNPGGVDRESVRRSRAYQRRRDRVVTFDQLSNSMDARCDYAR
jgi:hypothetical protein